MLTHTLISPDWTFALWAVMLGLTAFAFWAETTTLGRTVSGVALAMIAAMILSNVNLIPKSAPAYSLVWSYLVPLAIPLLLFKADLRRIIPETKGMFAAFLLGTVGTVIGTVLGVLILPLGENGAKLAGIFSATYTGGSMNMAAVGEALQVDSALMAVSVAADSVVGKTYLVFMALIPALGILRRWLPSTIMDQADREGEEVVSHATETVSLNLLHISFSLLLSLSICAVGYASANFLGVSNYGILFITALTVAVANLFPKQMMKLEGDYEIGMFFMYLFFVVVGAGADVIKMFDSALIIVLFAAIIILCHLIVLFLGSRLLKLDLAEAIIASIACASGPSVAAALAAGKRWRALITPAVMLGVLGYVVANFLGVTLATLLS